MLVNAEDCSISVCDEDVLVVYTKYQTEILCEDKLAKPIGAITELNGTLHLLALGY